MAVEKTCVLLKPDCMRRGLTGEIIARIEKKNLRIADIKMIRFDDALLRAHYAHIVDKPYYPRVVDYMMSGPVIAMVIKGESAIHQIRRIIGAATQDEAAPGTIRGDFAVTETRNIIHASDSAKTAAEEIRRFFGTQSNLPA